MASSAPIPTRLIICVDGTWCREDGVTFTGTQTNVNRIWASIKEGDCVDEKTGRSWRQKPIYFKGLGTADELDFVKRTIAGAFGQGYSKQVREVYELCCKLTSDDEVWLYGFSRGAFVVRAVAGLLHNIRAIRARDRQFERDYKDALNIYSSIRRASRRGSVYHFVRDKTNVAPTIQFVGVFDTVKALTDDDLHDITFNNGIQHMRQALALHENRSAMTPEAIYPDFGDPPMPLAAAGRSFVQAWFVGAHMDMGGSKSHDGLSLYPLQWMLEESRANGLVLEFDSLGRDVRIDNPLDLVFPCPEPGRQVPLDHTFESLNHIKTRVHDIRGTHKGRYKVQLNNHRSMLWRKEYRRIFGINGALDGYHPTVAQGTTVHPSVYFLLSDYATMLIPLNPLQNELLKNLTTLEMRMLGTIDNAIIDHGFWSGGSQVRRQLTDERWPIRILVCGNTGIGKSTLINRVFGVPVTKPSSRKRGDHDIWKEHKWQDRPDIVVHDSCGFETASEQEIKSVEQFLAQMAHKEQPKDRLHIIWFCLPASSNRTQEEATVRLFGAIAEHAPRVPLVIVATKKDQFLDNEHNNHKRGLRKQGRCNGDELEAECDKYAAEQLDKQVKQIETELREVMKGRSRLELCVPVWQDDPESIRHLTDETIACIDSDEVRLLCIAAQTNNIDIKVNEALSRVMKSYKDILGSATALAGIPGVAVMERTSAAIAVCQHIISAFGLPSIVDFKAAYEILKTNIWDDLGNGVMTAFAEGIAIVGVGGSIAAFGMPVFLAAGAINIPLVVPATTRLFLILACDLILILCKCFEECRHTRVSQPRERELAKNAREYRWSGMSREVHARVKDLVPRRNVIECYRTDKVRIGLQNIIDEYRAQIHVQQNGEVDTRALDNLRIKDERKVNQELADDMSEATAELKEKGLLEPASAGAERPDSAYSETSTLRDF